MDTFMQVRFVQAIHGSLYTLAQQTKRLLLCFEQKTPMQAICLPAQMAGFATLTLG